MNNLPKIHIIVSEIYAPDNYVLTKTSSHGGFIRLKNKNYFIGNYGFKETLEIPCPICGFNQQEHRLNFIAIGHTMIKIILLCVECFTIIECDVTIESTEFIKKEMNFSDEIVNEKWDFIQNII
jgi:hypothetical protein